MSLNAKEQAAVDAAVKLAEQHGKVDVAWDDPAVEGHIDYWRKAKVRNELVRTHKVVVGLDPFGKSVTLTSRTALAAGATTATTLGTTDTKKSKKDDAVKSKKRKRTRHEYRDPKELSDIVEALKGGLKPMIVGPTGTGKTHLMHRIAEMLDMELILINCKRDMLSKHFYGQQVIENGDIVYQDGPVTRACQCGKDKDGNEVEEIEVERDGKMVKEKVKPALLVFDEFNQCDPNIAMGMNNLLDDFTGERFIRLDNDGGRKVVAHSGMRIAFLGNTIGRGLTGEGDDLYVAQSDALDISTLDRVDVVFELSWNVDAEEEILRLKIGDDRIVKQCLKFRNQVRDHLKQGDTATPLSTRLVVALGNAYEIWGDINKAVKYGVLNKTMPEERALYNEAAMMAFGRDIQDMFRK